MLKSKYPGAYYKGASQNCFLKKWHRKLTALLLTCGATFHFSYMKTAECVSTPDAFYQALYENMLVRNTTFSIPYEGSYTDLYSSDLNQILRQIYAMDSAATSDDFDYMQYNAGKMEASIQIEGGTCVFTFHTSYQ